MEKSKVFFANLRARSGRNLLDKLSLLFDAAGFGSIIQKNDFVALKVHVGELGNVAYIRPPFVARVVELVKKNGGRPFVTDSNTLYTGNRSNAVDHMVNAAKNGFTLEALGAPFIVADGLNGNYHQRLPVTNGVRLKEALVGGVIAEADVLIALTHFKLHEAAGIGGSLKNISMGCASRAGKMEQHSGVTTCVDESVCNGCQRCIKVCPANAISLKSSKKAYVDEAKCIGCGECVATCNYGAMQLDWSRADRKAFQEKIAEYAKAIIDSKNGKCAFINVLMDISPNCDCWSHNDEPIVPDIGFLASRDIVAIDQASIDLVNSAPPLMSSLIGSITSGGSRHEVIKDKIMAVTGIDYAICLNHAVRLGLGSRHYELVEVS